MTALVTTGTGDLNTFPTEPRGAESSSRAPWRAKPADYAAAAFITVAIAIAGVLAEPALWHWYILPVSLCGFLIGPDAVRWIRSSGLFEPVGMVGVFGYHFFFLAPILHVVWDQWPRFLVPPSDWRPWLGYMALLNAAGLVAYRFALSSTLTKRQAAKSVNKAKWQLEPRRFWFIMTVAIGFAALAEGYALLTIRGVSAYEAVVLGRSSIQGLGWILAIGESLPLLCLIAWVVHMRRRATRLSTPLFVLAMSAFTLWQFVLTGLRGSRGNLVWAVVIALGIVHYTVYPIQRRMLLGFACLGLVFMYFYGFYKAVGSDALRAKTAGGRAELEKSTGRTVPVLLLQDLGRADIQAYVLYRYTRPGSQYDLQLGTTYISGLTSLVPSVIWPERPPGKLKSGTELVYGPGTYRRGVFHAQYVYGLGGEAILNFGLWLIPIAYFVFGRAVRRAQRFSGALAPDDSRRMLIPLVTVLCLLLLSSDIGNVAYTIVQFGLLPLIVVMSSSRLALASSK